MIIKIKKQYLSRLYETVCKNFPYWFACAVFMLPSIPVTMIFQEIIKPHVSEIISQSISLVIFLLIVSVPIFVIPNDQYNCDKKNIKKVKKTK